MFETPQAVVAALRRYRDAFDVASGSIVLTRSGRYGPSSDPFRAGFLERLDERQELVRRMRALRARERQLLVLWYVADLKVTQIADRLGFSRVHCYRLRDKALKALCDMAGRTRAGTSSPGGDVGPVPS